jgi:hypothetical protein
MAGRKKNDIGGVHDSENQTEQNVAYSNEGEKGHLTQSMKPGGKKVPTGSINKAGTSARWTKVNGNHHLEGDNPTNKEDGMEHYSVNVGHVNVRFTCGNGKGFSVAQGLKQFIYAAQAIAQDFCLLPLGGQDNNICIPADVPNWKEGIQKYFRHRVSVNNVAGSIKIQTKFSI